MDPIIGLLNRIRARPALYLGEESIDKLAVFVDGYWTRQAETVPGFHSDFSHFRVFLGGDYRHSALGWSGVLLNIAGSQRAALELFYQKLDAFVAVIEEIKRRPQVRWTEALGESSYMRHRCIRYQIEKYADGKNAGGWAMSEHVVKIIPCDPYRAYDCAEGQAMTEKLAEVLKPLRAEGVMPNDIGFEFMPRPEFIDCGSNLEMIRCPNCHTQLPFEWWGGAMDLAHAAGFEDLSVTTPCCKAKTTLNALEYDMPCGFASFCIRIENPRTEPTQKELEQIEVVMGCPVRMVTAHY